MKKFTTLLASSAAVLGLAGGVVAVSADSTPVATAQNINQLQSGQQNVPAAQAQTINSARAYLMNTIWNDHGQHMQGDLPTQAQNGASNWSVSKQTSNSATIDCNGTPLFTLTNNGNGTSNLDYCNWHFVVRNSDHKILGNVGEVSVPAQNNNQNAAQNNTQVAKTQQAAQTAQQNDNTQTANNKAVVQNNNAQTAAQQTAGNKVGAQSNTTAAQTQTSNNTAANETTTKNGGVFMKDNAKSLPQTGENSSEIMVVAGGMIIAMTAAGVVVYKKRN